MTSADVVAEIAAVRNRLAASVAVDRSGWSAANRSEVVLALLELRERADAAVLDATADWDNAEAWSPTVR